MSCCDRCWQKYECILGLGPYLVVLRYTGGKQPVFPPYFLCEMRVNLEGLLPRRTSESCCSVETSDRERDIVYLLHIYTSNSVN